MLRNIPANLSPELVRILMEMGHGRRPALERRRRWLRPRA